MYAAFDYDTNKTILQNHRADLTTQEAVLDELKAEWYNMLLFASSKILDSLLGFIRKPDEANLKGTAFSMREDLGREKLDLQMYI